MGAGGTPCPFWWGQGHFHRMLESEDFSGRLSAGGTLAEVPQGPAMVGKGERLPVLGMQPE